MEDYDNILNKLSDFLGKNPGNLNILEEQIDVDLQMEYFEKSKNRNKDLDPEQILGRKDEIYNTNEPEAKRKELFTQLAALENVEAFRVLESYVKSSCKELRNWAILAFQESRMLLESKFLDESQVFISTGLGGKGEKLRYFIVLIKHNDKQFSPLQKKITRSELRYCFSLYDSDVEKIQFTGRFCTIVAFIPLQANIKTVIRDCIEETNIFGNFLMKNFIVTNVKMMDRGEIEEFIDKNNSSAINPPSRSASAD